VEWPQHQGGQSMEPKFTLSETMNRFSTEEACKEFLQE
jgi:hypothetical protein